MAVINSINNKSSSLTVDPGASGDSALQLSINATPKFKIGIDDTDSDAFVISQGSALGTNNCLRISSDGEITAPLQPAFLAVLNADISNVTGDNTGYPVVWDTVAFDKNSDFDGTSTFTAPQSGRYLLSVGLSLGGITASHTQMYANIVTSNTTFTIFQCKPSAIRSVNNEIGLFTEVLCDMDISDTAYINVVVQNGSKVVDVITNNSSNTYSYFSGYLAC